MSHLFAHPAISDLPPSPVAGDIGKSNLGSNLGILAQMRLERRQKLFPLRIKLIVPRIVKITIPRALIATVDPWVF